MLNMSDINDIRDLYSRGCKIGEIARKKGFDPKTVRKYLNKEDFSEEAPAMTAKASILDPYKDLIADWLKEDQKRWNKQRHTAKRVYERLKQEQGFTGSYETVQRYMKKQNRNPQGKATQELAWARPDGSYFVAGRSKSNFNLPDMNNRARFIKFYPRGAKNE